MVSVAMKFKQLLCRCVNVMKFAVRVFHMN